MHRRELVNFIKKSCGEYFDPKDAQRDIEQIVQKADELNDLLEEAFI